MRAYAWSLLDELDWRRRFHGEPRGFPIRKPLGQATRSPTACLQDFDCAVGVHAIRPAAVGHVVLAPRQPPEPLLQLIDRDRERPWNMSRVVLASRTGVQHDDVL